MDDKTNLTIEGVNFITEQIAETRKEVAELRKKLLKEDKVTFTLDVIADILFCTLGCILALIICGVIYF